MKNSNLNIRLDNIDESKIAGVIQQIKYDVDRDMLSSDLTGKWRSDEWHRQYTVLLEKRVIINAQKKEHWFKRFFREVCFIKC